MKDHHLEETLSPLPRHDRTVPRPRDATWAATLTLAQLVDVLSNEQCDEAHEPGVCGKTITKTRFAIGDDIEVRRGGIEGDVAGHSCPLDLAHFALVEDIPDPDTH